MKRTLEHLEIIEELVSRDMEEMLVHGSRQFRMSVHMTQVPSMNNSVLYSHWHEELELLFVVKGSIQFHVGQDKFSVRSGEIVLIQPNLLHSASREGREEIVFYAVLVHFNFVSSLENDLIQQQYILPLFLQKRCYPKLITREMDQELKIFSLLEGVRDIYQQEPQGYELLVKARLLEIFYLLEKVAVEGTDETLRRSNAGHNSLLAKKMLGYVQQNYSKHISLTEMSKQVNMSPSYFCRFMKKQFDLTPMDFLNEYRISEAVTLMETTDKKIMEIAEMTGFCNINRFTEIFKKFYGCTPKSYRNAIRNKVENKDFTVWRDTDL